MGAESGRLSYGETPGAAAGDGGAPGGGGGGSETVGFPNMCPRREWEAPAWTLLHQCTLDKWKDGHAGVYHPATAVLFSSRPRSEGWPHHGRTFSIYLCPLSF